MLSEEDKADVKNAMGKAIANKVSKVTRDKSHVPANSNADLIRTARKSRDKGNLPAMGQKILASMSRENSAKSKALQGKKEGKPKFYASQMEQHGGFPKSEIEKARRYETKKGI